MNSFTDIYILDLHGNSKKRETAPDGGKDENVFDIQQGVAIGLFVKEPGKAGPAKVHHADLWGLRQGKYEYLAENAVDSTEWQELKPHSPFYLFVSRQEDLNSEYEKGWKVTDIFIFTGEGFTSHRDNFAVAFTESEIKERINSLVKSDERDETIRDIYTIKDTNTWKLTEARKAMRLDKEMHKAIQPCLYRPFDKRFCLLHASIMERPRMQTQAQMMKANIALSTTRNVEIASGFSHILCVSQVMDRHAVSIKEINYVFPLYLYPAEGELDIQKGRQPNLNPAFIAEVERRLGVRSLVGPEGEVKEPHWRTPPDLWDKLKPVARQMRREPTEAENILWQHIRNHQLLGFKFRRQHSIERFIVDFYCAEARLVVEVDGPIHQYQQEDDQVRQEFLESQGLRVLRFSNDDVLHSLEQVLQQIKDTLTSPPTPSPLTERGPEGEVITPEDIFNYIYAIFHSPTYRSRYAEFLKTDFPRLPLTSDKVLFKAMSDRGAELVSLHLMESPKLSNFVTKWTVSGSNIVEKVAYVDSTKRVYINKDQYFEGVPFDVWEFQVGGYQVCEKWLKDRKGRKLSLEDIEHYQKIVVAIKETIRIMKEIDELITKWPIE